MSLDNKMYTFKCSKCNLISLKKKSFFNPKISRWIYTDINKKRLYGSVCHLCKMKMQVSYARRIGRNSHINDVSCQSIKTGRDNEKKVVNYLNGFGFDVELNSKNTGPDLIVYTTVGNFKIEVKTAYSAPAGYLTGKIKGERLKDDITAIVLPDDNISFNLVKNYKRYHPFRNKKTL